jgi:hypothetical protein
MTVFLTIACVGDNAIRVKGTIAYPGPCQLELREAEGQPLIDSRPVRGAFIEGFSVSPSRRTHLVTVACGGVAVASAQVGENQYVVPYDFGEIPSSR